MTTDIARDAPPNPMWHDTCLFLLKMRFRISFCCLALFSGALVTTLLLAGCSNDAASDPKLTDATCGTAVTAKLGERLVVSLASTYWQFQDSPPTSPIQQKGTTVYAGGLNCPSYPGSGCGTATATFDILGSGQAVISASRTTCGEAVACDHGEGKNQCTITVNVAP